MKKLLKLLGLVAMASALLIGCGGTTSGGTPDSQPPAPDNNEPSVTASIIASVKDADYKDGVITKEISGDWNNFTVELTAPTDFSKGVSFKGFTKDWVCTDDPLQHLKICLHSDDSHASEHLLEFPKDTSAEILFLTTDEAFGDGKKAWSANGEITDPADLTKVTKIVFYCAKERGKLTVEDIQAVK